MKTEKDQSRLGHHQSGRIQSAQNTPEPDTGTPTDTLTSLGTTPSIPNTGAGKESSAEISESEDASGHEQSTQPTIAHSVEDFPNAVSASATESGESKTSDLRADEATMKIAHERAELNKKTIGTSESSMRTRMKAFVSPSQRSALGEHILGLRDNAGVFTMQISADYAAQDAAKKLDSKTSQGVPITAHQRQHLHDGWAVRANRTLTHEQASALNEDNTAVLEYLLKKGYTKSEAMFRLESAAQEVEGRPMQQGMEDLTAAKYGSAFALMREWIEDTCLDIYKADLRRLQWPVFVYSFLKLVADYRPSDSRSYFRSFKESFEAEHPDDLRALEPISLPEHLETNETARIYRDNKYRLRMTSMAFNNLIIFLEGKEKEGTRLIVTILTQNVHVATVERSAENESALAKLLARAKAPEDFPAEDEGIPGHNPGSANTEQVAGSSVLTRLKLGPLPMEPDLMGDVRGELEEEDAKSPPAEGQASLAQHFDQQIKREESEDAPTRMEVPLPPSTARDVAMEVQKVKENRDRFKIEGRTGGVGPGVSVVMFTFHNTFDGITCMDFSQDNTLIAAGLDQHYIRVWTVDGKALPALEGSNEPPSASRRLIGHSGCVYNISFGPSATPSGASDTVGSSTTSKHLLSCSADGTVRLWSLETWTCLVVYKGHSATVWDVKWGPFGHYFATGSSDRTARLWATNDISFLRIFVGHDKDVDVVCFHPNNAYLFTGSCDRTVRMWKVMDGNPVRMFTGHTGNITSMACSPSGKLLASADDAGTIILWDLAPGRLLKRMRGHAKGGIWSLSWSVESTVLVSGAMDGTVRVWDVAPPNDANGQGRVVAEGGAGQKIDANPQAQTSAAGGVKKKNKEVVVTSDQISAFPTKKSPVYKVQFTRQNLVMAGGAYMP